MNFFKGRISVCIVLSFFTSLLFFSCRTLNEVNVVEKNIASEYYKIADAYVDFKKYDKAITYYKLSMREPSLKNAAYYKLGRTYALQGSFADAEKVFFNLLKLDENNQSLKVSLAYVYGKNGKIEKALELYSELLDSNPDDSEILVNYILLLITNNNLDEAQSQLLILEQKFPDSKNIEDLQNSIYTKLSDTEKDSNSD